MVKTKKFTENRIRYLEASMMQMQDVFKKIPGTQFDSLEICKIDGVGQSYFKLLNGQIYRLSFDGKDLLLLDANTNEIISDAKMRKPSQILTYSAFMKKDLLEYVRK